MSSGKCSELRVNRPGVKALLGSLSSTVSPNIPSFFLSQRTVVESYGCQDALTVIMRRQWDAIERSPDRKVDLCHPASWAAEKDAVSEPPSAPFRCRNSNAHCCSHVPA